MYPHRIRLRQAWQRQPEGADEISISRRFGFPGRIDSHERVWLTLAGLRGPSEIWLNTIYVGRGRGDLEFDVTPLLHSRNEVTIKTAPADPSFDEVSLEIRATAFLRDVRLARAPEGVIATGLVVGHSVGLLELYLVLDRAPVGYATIVASEDGTPFRLAAPEQGPAAVAKLELVQGAVSWYTVQVELP